MAVDSIPYNAIVEARNALADDYFTLKESLEGQSAIAFFHRRRTVVRVSKIEGFLDELDSWLTEVKR